MPAKVCFVSWIFVTLSTHFLKTTATQQVIFLVFQKYFKGSFLPTLSSNRVSLKEIYGHGVNQKVPKPFNENMIICLTATYYVFNRIPKAILMN